MTKLPLILHGDNQLASRQAFQQLKDQASGFVSLDGRLVQPTQLLQVLEGDSLFDITGPVFIENLSTTVIDYLAQHPNAPVILWEGKKIPATTLKKLGRQTQEFKVNPIIFTFLESLKPAESAGRPQNTATTLKNFDLASGQDAVELIFHMIIRQVRQLIQVLADPTQFKGPSWLANKLLAQAKSFGLTRLLELHHQLYLLDKAIKTGGTNLDLKTELELWMIKL